MAEKQVTVVATFKAKAGMEGTVRDGIQAMVAPTRAEAGCINYDLHQSAEDPSVFMLYENWVSKQALDDHLAKPYLEAFLSKADDILAEPVNIALWQMIGEPGK